MILFDSYTTFILFYSAADLFAIKTFITPDQKTTMHSYRQLS